MTLHRTATNQSSRSRRSCGETLSQAASKVKSNQETYASPSDPLVGHLGHLTREQAEALDTFKTQCREKQLYTPAEGDKAASHDDATLLRFLRARRFDVKGALDQFEATENWRKENQIKDLYENFDLDSYEESRRVYPQWTGRRDRRGIPVYVFVIKDLNSKNMAAYSSSTMSKATSSTHSSSKVPPRLLRLFALYENMIRFVLPLCSSLPRPNPETQIVSTTNIVDISGVGLKQFWNLKGHMQDASVLATAHYPETLDRIFIIGAPSFFPTVWGWIKRWFDPVTTSKIFILPASEVKSTLSSFIDPANFPKRYGGELDWEWGDMPNLDEPARALIGPLERIGEFGDKEDSGKDDQGAPKSFVKGPVVWNNNQIEIYGSVNGKQRNRVLAPDTDPKTVLKPAISSTPNGALTDKPNSEAKKVVVDAQGTQINGTVQEPAHISL
ncbi:hypothetical protein VTO42DRAFT_4000 [Malbranchea cinnamomea]